MIMTYLFACISIIIPVIFIGIIFSALELIPRFKKAFKPKLFPKLSSDVSKNTVADDTIKFVENSEHEKYRAYVRCSSERTAPKKSYTYTGIKSCALLKEAYLSENVCRWGCIGYGDCAIVCPQNAIIIENGTAIISTACNGCGICMTACPNGLIERVPINADYVIPCAAKGGNISSVICQSACTSCGACVRAGLLDGFSFNDQTVHIDYRYYGSRSGIADLCPQKCIKKYEKKEKSTFTLWLLCVTLFKRKKISSPH